LAVSADDKHWFLLGASPDLRYQIEGCRDLQPRKAGRNSPICGVLLTCADLDHSLGLLLLREWQRLTLYSTVTVRRLLLETNTVFRLLERMPGQIRWTDVIDGQPVKLIDPEGLNSGMIARFFGFPGSLPAYAPSNWSFPAGDAVSALIVEAPSGKRIAYVPGLPEISSELLSELDRCDTILIDGTFWTDDELIRVEGFGHLATEIGHLPVSGPDGSLQVLSGLRTPRKIYVHINNTNPMLDEESEEHRLVCASGWEIASDGMEFAI
jgi:pyrroloquinoline quinone biosynthesis protein B